MNLDNITFYPVEVISVIITENQKFYNPFNQATFANTGLSTVLINDIPLAPNTERKINLNVLEICKTNFNIDFQGAANGQLTIVFTQYTFGQNL